MPRFQVSPPPACVGSQWAPRFQVPRRGREIVEVPRFQGSRFQVSGGTCGVLTSVQVPARLRSRFQVPGSWGRAEPRISGRHISKLFSDPFLLMVMPWVVPGLDGCPARARAHQPRGHGDGGGIGWLSYTKVSTLMLNACYTVKPGGGKVLQGTVRYTHARRAPRTHIVGPYTVTSIGGAHEAHAGQPAPAVRV